jgi:hypothetical protein
MTALIRYEATHNCCGALVSKGPGHRTLKACPRRSPTSTTSTSLKQGRIDEVPAFYVTVAVGLDERRISNLSAIRRLRGAFTLMMCGMLLEVCGLAIAAAVA